MSTSASRQLSLLRFSATVAVALTLATSAHTAHANVYATNIKLNGGLTNATVAPGSSVTISYVLNEAASQGVTLNILSGSTVVRSLAVAPGAAGTVRGLNTLIWDGKDAGGQSVAAGTYAVSVTAAATGYNQWTQTTQDNSPGSYVWEGHGLAINRNTNSIYYGRIFVSNSHANTGGTLPGDQVGVLKYNADGSFADEGGFSTGGQNWGGAYVSPWRVEVSDDDYVYVNDWSGNGEIYRFDQVLSPESKLYVLRPDNWGNDGAVSMSGPAITGTGTNTQIWMADVTVGGLGLIRYTATADGTCATNDVGVPVVGTGGSLNLYPYDVALDKSGNIYTIQNVAIPGDTSPRVLRFPAYDPATNGSTAQYTADWAVGATNDNYGSAQGIAVDPTGTYVAVAFAGVLSSTWVHGNTAIFYATNGALVTSLDLDTPISGNTEHKNTDCAWDAVGNVYYIDNWVGYWRRFSPPGPNQATTVAVPVIQIRSTQPPQAPQISRIAVSGGTTTIDFTGATADEAGLFKVLNSSSVTGAYTTNTTATVTRLSAGSFQATVPISGPSQFYRIQR